MSIQVNDYVKWTGEDDFGDVTMYGWYKGKRPDGQVEFMTEEDGLRIVDSDDGMFELADESTRKEEIQKTRVAVTSESNWQMLYDLGNTVRPSTSSYRTGTKKERAIEIYAEMMEQCGGRHPQRKDVIERFTENGWMSFQGASTYQNMMKHHFNGDTNHDSIRGPRTGTKKERAIKLYAQMMERCGGRHPIRKDVIAKFMEDDWMTFQGASTYQNMMKHHFS